MTRRDRGPREASWESLLFCILRQPQQQIDSCLRARKKEESSLASRRLRMSRFAFLFCLLFYILFNFIFSISRSRPRERAESCVRMAAAKTWSTTLQRLFLYREHVLFRRIFNYVMIQRGDETLFQHTGRVAAIPARRSLPRVNLGRFEINHHNWTE